MAGSSPEDKSAQQMAAAAADVLERDVGTWDAAIEIRPSPGAAPQVSRGTSVRRRACGGRWLIVDFRNETGFEGHGVYGWDAGKGKFTGVWVDSARGFIAVSEGVHDAEKRTMTYVTDAVVNGRTTRWRETTESEAGSDTDPARPRKQIYRFFMPGPDGVEFEMMTVTYTLRAG